MRISTQVFFQRNVDSVLSQQTKLSQQNMHLSTQKLVIHGSDDAVAISTIQRLKQDLSMGDQYIKNGEMGETANSLEDVALGQTTNILQRVRELMVTAGNETYGEKDREAIAKELEGLREELMGVANMKDGNSQYIFAGYQVDTKPFQKNEFGSIDYHGDGGSKDYKVGAGVTVKGNDSGSAVFYDIAEGNGTFIAERGSQNGSSGVIDAGSVINKKTANSFPEQDYTVVINKDLTPGAVPEYSVYGLDDAAATGSANVKISGVDLNDPNIANVNPAGVHPALNSAVNVEFLATATPGEFEVRINNVSSLPGIYNSNDTTAQEITIDGISIEVDGVPNTADSYAMTKYIEPTVYAEGQSIEFNGIKTEIRGEVGHSDSFTLRQSGENDVFSTIQDTINALRIPGEDGDAKSQRTMALSNAHLQIDNAMSNVTRIHTSVGARMKTIENQRESSLDFNLTNKKTLSNLEDLDMASAISEFKLQMSQLEVSQQTFIQMQSLSLFKLI